MPYIYILLIFPNQPTSPFSRDYTNKLSNNLNNINNNNKKRHTELIYSLWLCLSFLSFSPFFIYGIVGSFYVRACVCVYMCALNESNSIISLPFLPPPLPPSAFQRIRLPRNCASHWKARLEGRMTFSCCFLTYYDVFSILFLTFGTSIQHDCRDSARPAVDQSRPSALRIWMKSHN